MQLLEKDICIDINANEVLSKNSVAIMLVIDAFRVLKRALIGFKTHDAWERFIDE